MKRCAILLELREPMFMQVATMSVNHCSTMMSPFSSRMGLPPSSVSAKGMTTVKLHVRSSSGAISNWKNMCLPSDLKPARYVSLTSAMWLRTAESP